MSNVAQPKDVQELPKLQGHTIGFVDTDAACDAIMQDLNKAGFPDAKLQVLWGEDGLHLLQRIADASSWGESAEEVLKQGTVELHDGHSLILVEVQNDEEAATAAAVCTPHGAHGIYHFGLLVDTRLTA